MFLFFIFSFSNSIIKRKKKYNIYPKSNNNDLVTLDQMIKMGWNSITWDSIDELNRCLYEFDITTPNRIRHFIVQCSYHSKFGTQLTDETSHNDEDNWWYQYGIGNIYRGSGYLLLSTKKNYNFFEMYMSDPEILKKGADYIVKYYPWTSAGFLWMMRNVNHYCYDKSSIEIVSKTLLGIHPNDDSIGWGLLKVYRSFFELEKLYLIAEKIF